MAKSPVREPQTLLEAIHYFSDQDRAFEFVKRLRWPHDVVACPRCGCIENTFVSTRKLWKCKGCRTQFSLKVGTIFEDSPIGWDKWLPAVWLIANSKNSVSSHELARALGVTQKTSWFMLHRIRTAMENETFEKLSGTVEVDETYVGGDARNMHQYKRSQKVTGRGPGHKTAVQGARERETGKVKASTITGTFRSNVDEWVEPGSNVFTDEHKSYRSLDNQFSHKYVTHSREYVSGIVHTNGIENFWALLKRSIKGTQVHVDPRHLDRYVTERAFAYNNRTSSDAERMQSAMLGTAGRRLTYAELTVPTRPKGR
jgi:transposase-like protein